MNSKTIESDPARWSQVEEMFAHAAGLDSDDCSAYLESACAGDDELRDYVLALLNSDGTIAIGIEKTIVETMNRAFDDGLEDADKMRGEMIGPYRVERLLGSGGMGIVYLAERADQQFDQQVAIKLGRHRLVDPQTVLRLRNERQILSDLDHPNIARLFDGGTTDDGVPYLVMEYIDGVRIDTYCDVHRLGIVARLRLFQTICAAVHHAHQSLVIHRDIKASNILVTNEGVPKLLDFGIAKLTDPAGTETDGLTREGAVIMTPANATPEQVQGKAATTAIDVYALGLLLYDLLSGFRACETDGLTPGEFARIVCHQQAIKPSLLLAQKSYGAKRRGDAGAMHELEGIADDRGVSIARLQRQLRGDLDTIVLNTLRKEPERRYRSVSALADDIDLHLRSMPIVARADSWRYRAGKFMRRHYAAVSVSVLVVAMLATFTVLLSIQNRNVVRERDTAREVSQFLEDIFMAQDPAQARGVKITAEQILAIGARRIQNDLRDRPEIQAALIGTIGRVYVNLGAYKLSADMLEQALQIRLRTHGEDHPSVAAARNDLAATLIWRAEYQRAKQLLESSLAINERASGPDSEAVAHNLSNLASLHWKTGELDKAETFAESTISIYAQLGNSHEIQLKLATAKATLARILQVRGNLDRTEELLLEAIDIVTNSVGPNYPAMAFYLQNLGVLQRSKGDLDAAKETLDRAVVTARRILGEKSYVVAATLTDQGILLHMAGDLKNAEKVMREALALYIETRGRDNPAVGYVLTLLGMLLHDKSELAESENVLRRAMRIYDDAPDFNHQYIASAMTELGAVLNTSGHLAEAENLLELALTIRLQDYASDHELVAATRTEYADTLTRLGFYEQAEPLLHASVQVLRDKPGRRQQRAAEALERLVERRGLGD